MVLAFRDWGSHSDKARSKGMGAFRLHSHLYITKRRDAIRDMPNEIVLQRTEWALSAYAALRVTVLRSPCNQVVARLELMHVEPTATAVKGVRPTCQSRSALMLSIVQLLLPNCSVVCT